MVRRLRPLPLPIAALLAAWLPAQGESPHAADVDRDHAPNIVLIYADDVGFGDVGCNGATAVVTPNIDRLAEHGMRFTDAHCTSATCTPSRYSLLTGEYAFRRKGTGVLPGNAKLIIDPGRATLPGILRRAGYRTAVVGKWHLGLGDGNLDWNGEIAPGPLELGFDECLLLPATGDRVPCVYVEGHHVVGLDPADPIQVSYGKRIGDAPTGKERPDLLRVPWDHGHDQTIVNGISRIGYMTGGTKARWVDEDMAQVFTTRALTFLEQNKDRRFFLYFATHDIHVPRAPNPRFVGKTGMGPRGDAIAQLDWCVGEILDGLDRLGLARDTLVVFTSDNGPVVNDGYQDDAEARLGEHRPAGPWRGGKYSAFEAGTRVPMIVRWPGHVQPGVSPALTCQVDLCASFAKLTGQVLADDDAPDSTDQLGALLGLDAVGRDHLIEHAGTLSLRARDWKFVKPGRGAAFAKDVAIELGNDSQPQLYDLREDPGERHNLAAAEPERATVMAAQLAALEQAGRTRPRTANAAPPKGKLQVFVLAGQSNMEGKGRVEHLLQLAEAADAEPSLAALRHDGQWVARDDVWIDYLDRRGPLTVGYGNRTEFFGPELLFGRRVGEHFAEPVLLVKIAWGGRSLAVDFRPPGAGGTTGPSYVEMIARVRDVLLHLREHCPAYDPDAGHELAGFVWFQGWNDRINEAFVDEYASNLAHLVRDVRKDLGAPGLPFVIGETGQGGPDEKNERALRLQRAQSDVASLPEFAGTARFVATRTFWQQEPHFDGGYHWFGNAANFAAIGDAFGRAMVELLGQGR